MKAILYLTFLLISTVAQAFNIGCLMFFQNFAQKIANKPDLKSFSAQETNLVLLSGKNINDLGYFRSCKQKQDQRYILVLADAEELPSELMLGICGPRTCTQSDYYELQSTAQLMLQNSLEGIINRTIPIKGSLKFIDPSQIDIQNGKSYDVVLYILITVFALTLINCIYKCFSKLPEESDDTQLLLSSYYESISTQIIDDENQNTIVPLEESRLKKFINCFNFTQHLRTLWKTKPEPWHDEDLNTLFGVRALAFFYIILSQTFDYEAIAIKNYAAETFNEDSYAYLFIIAGSKAVDIFFFLSGFLAAYILLSKLRKMKLTVRAYLEIIFHRWFRIWPTYMIALLIYWKISVHLPGGPIWPFYVSEAQGCSQTWWNNVFLLDNWLIEEGQTYCMNWSWYLAVDFQLYLVTPILISLYVRYPKLMTNALGYIIVFSLVYNVVMNDALGNNFQLYPEMSFDALKYIYQNPLGRASVYFLGVAFGISFTNYKTQDGGLIFSLWESNSIARRFSILIGSLLIGYIILAPRTLQIGGTWAHWYDVGYQSISGFLFVLGMIFIIASAMVNGWIFLRTTLSCGFFNFIAKISFSGYLLHGTIIMTHIMRQETSQEFSLRKNCGDALANIVIISSAAVILYALIERPLRRIEGTFMKYSYAAKEGLVTIEDITGVQIGMRTYTDDEKTNAFASI